MERSFVAGVSQHLCSGIPERFRESPSSWRTQTRAHRRFPFSPSSLQGVRNQPASWLGGAGVETCKRRRRRGKRLLLFKALPLAEMLSLVLGARQSNNDPSFFDAVVFFSVAHVEQRESPSVGKKHLRGCGQTQCIGGFLHSFSS